MIPTTMIFTHLLRVLSIINITDIDLTSVDSLTQTVDAFLAKIKAENQTSSTEQPDPNVTPLLLFFDFTKDIEDKVSISDIKTLTNDEITQMYPDAITKHGYVKAATLKTSLKNKIWKCVYSLRLYKDAIDNSKFMADKNNQKINGCNDLTVLRNARNESVSEKNTKMKQIANKFKSYVVPWFGQWAKFLEDHNIWHKNVSDKNKKDLLELIVEMQIDNYNKREEYLKKCFDALFVMIDAQIKVLEDKAAVVTTPDTPVTSLDTSVTTPDISKDFSDTSKDLTTDKTSTALEPKHEEKKEEVKPKTSLSLTTIAFICIGIGLGIISVGIGAFYGYKKWKHTEGHDTMIFEHYNIEGIKEEL